MAERVAHPSLVGPPETSAMHLLVEVKAEAEVSPQGNALWAAADGMQKLLAHNGLLALPIEMIAVRMVKALHASAGDDGKE